MSFVLLFMERLICCCHHSQSFDTSKCKQNLSDWLTAVRLFWKDLLGWLFHYFHEIGLWESVSWFRVLTRRGVHTPSPFGDPPQPWEYVRLPICLLLMCRMNWFVESLVLLQNKLNFCVAPVLSRIRDKTQTDDVHVYSATHLNAKLHWWSFHYHIIYHDFCPKQFLNLLQFITNNHQGSVTWSLQTIYTSAMIAPCMVK